MANIPFNPALLVQPVQVGNAREDWGGQEMLAVEAKRSARRARALAQGIEQAAGFAAGMIKEHVEKKGNQEREADLAAGETAYRGSLASTVEKAKSLTTTNADGSRREDLEQQLDDLFAEADAAATEYDEGATDGVPNVRHAETRERLGELRRAARADAYVEATEFLVMKYDRATRERFAMAAQDILDNPGVGAEARIDGLMQQLAGAGTEPFAVEQERVRLTRGVQARRADNVLRSIEDDIDGSDPSGDEDGGEPAPWRGAFDVFMEDLDDPAGPYSELTETDRGKIARAAERSVRSREAKRRAAGSEATAAWRAYAWQSLAQDPNLSDREIRALATRRGRSEPDEELYVDLSATADAYTEAMERQSRPSQGTPSGNEAKLDELNKVDFFATLEMRLATAQSDGERATLRGLVREGLRRDFMAYGECASYLQRIEEAGKVARPGDELRRRFWKDWADMAGKGRGGMLLGVGRGRSLAGSGSRGTTVAVARMREGEARLEEWLASHPHHSRDEREKFLSGMMADVRADVAKERILQAFLGQIAGDEVPGSGANGE